MPLGKLQEGDGTFFLGQDSSLDPAQLAPGQYSRGMNVVTRGGTPQCRPGYQCQFVLPHGRQQGGCFFKPKIGAAMLVFGVSGLLYASEFPFTSFRQIPSVALSPDARQLYFQQVEKSVQLNGDGSITLVAPKNILIVQDGALSAPVQFDGTFASNSRDTDSNIPLGGPMAWIADRLWVARGSSLFASDIANPTSFTEELYFATASQFSLTSTVTALAPTPGALQPQLLAFTETSTTLFQAGIRDRAAWATTPNFQVEIFPKVGCVGQRGVIEHYGFLWWYSSVGLMSLDSAAQANVSSELPSKDNEMSDSKSKLSADLSGVAGISFENYLLLSVPHADLLNTHTWVLDQTPLKSGQKAPPIWNSFWTGTRPVEWLTCKVNGVNRCFHISEDYDGEARLWEAFTPDRLDDGCPITWWVETRAVNLGATGKLKEFRYADVFLSELTGRVDVAVFYAGSHRGRYKKILEKRIQAARGSIRSVQTITSETLIFALKKQSRELRTQDGRSLIAETTMSSCGVESPNLEFKDEAFQLLIVGSGPGAIRGYVVYAEPPTNEDDSGRVEADETEENFVRFDGAASESSSFEEALAQFTEDIPQYFSTRTATVTQGALTEVATGEGESIISQSNADYIADVTARRTAVEALQQRLPRIVSVGAIANEL